MINKKQEVLRITLPGGVQLYPSKFRELLAKVPGLPNELFHRDEHGKTINCRPPIRTIGGVGWVGIVADPNAEDLLRLAVGPAIMAVTQEIGVACPVQLETREFSLVPTQFPRRYILREMVIKKGMVQEEDKLQVLVKAKIEKSVEDICASNGFDCPSKENLGVYVHEITGVKGLRLQTTAGVTNRYVGLLNARVVINAELNGLWAVGGVTSRGYGRLIKEHKGMKTALKYKERVLV